MRHAVRRARLAAILVGVAAPADASVFVVNTGSNAPTPGGCLPVERAGPPGDMATLPLCSLPTAVAEANARAGADEIVVNLLGPQRITLAQTLAVSDDLEINAAALTGWSGQLLLTSLVLDTTAADLLDVSAGKTQLRDLTLENGNVVVDPSGASVTFALGTGTSTYAEDIGGAGAVEKQGGGTLVLTGTNTFSGGTTIGQGTLQGDTLSIPGGTLADPFDVEDDARLVFDQQDDDPQDFFGAIGGTGSVELVGGGTLRLQTANTYSGGTTITSGTLIGFAGAGASLQGDIVDNDELVFLQAADGTFADDITGSGRVEKQGAGTLTLTGANRFGGGLEIAQGVLIGDSDAIPGNVEIGSGAQLVFDQAANGTHSGNITGGGGAPPGGFTLIKRGAGTLTLNGSNSFSGDTSLELGSLQVTSQSLRGDVVVAPVAGSILFSQDFDGSYAGVITSAAGDGAAVDLVKRGSGALSLLSTQLLQADDASEIEGGSLVVGVAGQGGGAGTTLPGALDVRSGTLAGIGEVGGAVTVQSGARISPGALGGAMGTLRVGSVSFLPGSTLELQVDESDTDLLVADAATIGAGAVLDVAFAQIAPGADFTQVVLSAAGGVTGSFLLDQELCFFTVEAVTGANSVSVDVSPKGNAQLVDCADTRNQRAVATALEEAHALASPGGDLDAVFAALGALPEDEVPGALDEMAGEQLTEFATTRLAIADRMTTSVHERIRGLAWSDREALLAAQTRDAGGPVLAGDPVLQRALPGVVQGFAAGGAFPTWFGAQSMSTVLDSGTSFQPLQGENGLGGWIDGYGLFGALDGNADSSDLDYLIGGFSLGVDYLVAKNVLVGAAGGYAYSTLDFDHLSGDQTANTGQGALYAGYVTPWLRLGASGRFGYSAMETRRDIDFMSRRADADFSGWDAGGRVEAALDLFKIAFVEVQPLASFSYTHVQQDSFDESGADSLDLDVDEQNVDSLVSGVGARFHGLFQMDETLWFHPELHATWLHEFGDTERELDARIGGTPGAIFTVRGAEPSADVGVFGVRWTVVSAGRLHVFADYDVALSSALFQQGVSAGFKVVW